LSARHTAHEGELQPATEHAARDSRRERAWMMTGMGRNA